MPTPEDMQISPFDVRPDAHGIDAMRDALKEVHAVKGIVDGWVEELERLTSENIALAADSRLAWALDRLQEDVQWTLNESADILISGQSFAKAMDEMLNNAARRSDTYSASAWGGEPPGGTVNLTSADTAPVLEAGDSICAHSETLSRHVEGIQEQLKTFAELLKETRAERTAQRKEKEKNTWEGFLWNLLYVGLRFIARVMSACSKASTVIKYGAVVSVILGEGSKLANSAADLCREKDSEEESLQRVLHFLEDKIPKEMKRAEDSLTAFQTCHRMLQVDFAIQNGHKVRMGRQDAQRARDEWRAYRQRLQVLANDNAATVASAMVLQEQVRAY